jgi:hypothetical protein
LALLMLRWVIVLALTWGSGKGLNLWPGGKPGPSADSSLMEERRWRHPGTPGD